MKYKLTNKTRKVDGITLHQIQALINFKNVKAGDLGGWIESEYNLSQEDNCWVFGNARVYGNAKIYDNAWVYGNAEVYGNAKVFDNARVFGNAWVFGDVRVYGNARVFGYAEVYGNARVYGNKKIGGSEKITENINKPISKNNSIKKSELKQIIRECINEI